MIKINNRRLRLMGIVFLGLSVSWLLAPSMTRQLRVGPNMISDYESAGMSLSAVFRACDALAAVLLIAGSLINFSAIKKRYGRFAPFVPVIIGALMLLDIFMTVHCRVVNGICHEKIAASVVHVAESVGLVALVFGSSVVIARRHHLTRWFVAAQVVTAAAGFTSLQYNERWIFLIQATYQIFQSYWLYHIVFASTSQRIPAPQVAQVVRRVIAVWMAANGLVSIALTWRHLVFGRVARSFIFANDATWLLGHTLLVGLLLLYVARQLWHGDRRAYFFAALLLLSEVLHASLLPSAVVLVPLFGIPLLVMIYAEAMFDRHGSFAGATSRLKFIAAGVAVIAAVTMLVTVGFRFHDPAAWKHRSLGVAHVVEHVLLLDASADQDDPRRVKLLLRVLNVLGAAVYAWVVAGIFLPKSSFGLQPEAANSEDMRGALEDWSSSSEDFFKVWPKDKSYYRTSRGALIAYRQQGDIVLALANPIGPEEQCAKDVLEFKKYCRVHALKVAWIMVDEAAVAGYKKAGLRLVQIGSSAVVSLQTFCTKTVRSKWWRWQVNRGARAGYEYRLHEPMHSADLLKKVRQVSDAWLTRPGHKEQGFAMGYYDEPYLQQCRLHCLYRAGKLVAVLNELPVFGDNDQTTVDLIRFMPDADGAMQCLLAATLQQLQHEERFTKFDLGLVPLAKVDTQAAKLVSQMAGPWFSAQGLAQFKNKFDPEWVPNYIAYDGDVVDFAKILLALNKAMSLS